MTLATCLKQFNSCSDFGQFWEFNSHGINVKTKKNREIDSINQPN